MFFVGTRRAVSEMNKTEGHKGCRGNFESCNSPLVFRRKIGGVPRRGEVVIIPH